LLSQRASREEEEHGSGQNLRAHIGISSSILLHADLNGHPAAWFRRQMLNRRRDIPDMGTEPAHIHACASFVICAIDGQGVPALSICPCCAAW